MDINQDALVAALKMAGQDTTQWERTLQIARAVQAIRKGGADPQSIMRLLAILNPRYRALSALITGLQPQPAMAREAPSADNVQRNHF